jgi:hypothetical protein
MRPILSRLGWLGAGIVAMMIWEWMTSSGSPSAWEIHMEAMVAESGVDVPNGIDVQSSSRMRSLHREELSITFAGAPEDIARLVDAIDVAYPGHAWVEVGPASPPPHSRLGTIDLGPGSYVRGRPPQGRLWIDVRFRFEGPRWLAAFDRTVMNESSEERSGAG